MGSVERASLPKPASNAAALGLGHPVVVIEKSRQDIAIGVRDLVVGFGDRIILNHLDLDVCRGEILGVIGASGSGKSVLTRAILGLLPKREGHIEVFGEDAGPTIVGRLAYFPMLSHGVLTA